jgi:hypothetical protein
LFDIITDTESVVDINGYAVEDVLNPSTLEKNMHVWVANVKENESLPGLWKLLVTNFNLNLLVLEIGPKMVKTVSPYLEAIKVRILKKLCYNMSS